MEKKIGKMSLVVIECELRAAWAEVECAVRHGLEPSKALGAYIAALEAEKVARHA